MEYSAGYSSYRAYLPAQFVLPDDNLTIPVGDARYLLKQETAYNSNRLGGLTLAEVTRGGIQDPIELSTQDLNSLTTPNTYFQPANANALSSRNYPQQSAGSLTVYKAAGVIQEYRIYNSSIVWHRALYTGTAWTRWAKKYDTENKPSKADVGLSNVPNYSFVDSVGDSSGTKFASARAVKQAYDLAASKITQAQGDTRYLGINARAKDSEKLYGYNPSIAIGNSTVPVRDSSGYLAATSFKSTIGNQSTINSGSGIAFRVNNSSDSALRFINNMGNFRTFIGLGNVPNYTATSSVSDSSNSKFATAGAVKTAYDKGVEALNKANSINQYLTLATDKRDVKPNSTGTSNIRAVKPFFVSNASAGLGGVHGTYSDFLVFDTYQDGSGGLINGLIFSKASPRMYITQATWNSTSWGTVYEVFTKYNRPTKADVGLSNVNNWSASSSATSSSTSVYATSAAVKTAYDLAASKITKAQGDSYYLGKTAKATDSDRLDGWHGSQSGGAANNVAVRDGSADVHARLFRSEYSNTSSIPSYAALAFRNNNSTDNFIRFVSSPASVKSWIGLGNVNNWVATSSVSDGSTSKYATAAAVKSANDNANTRMKKWRLVKSASISVGMARSSGLIFRTTVDAGTIPGLEGRVFDQSRYKVVLSNKGARIEAPGNVAASCTWDAQARNFRCITRWFGGPIFTFEIWTGCLHGTSGDIVNKYEIYEAV